MNGLIAKIRRLFYRLRHDYLTFNNVVLAAAFLLCFIWVWSSISAMTKNWELSTRVDARRQEAARLKLELETLELETAYHKTEEYQELAAREKQNKMREGETMLVLPENSEAAREKYKTSAPAPASKTSNFDDWLHFLFGA
jgi:hypothetical protein